MSELVKQHHEHMGVTEIRKLLNRAIGDFCIKTKIVETSFTFTIDSTNHDDRWIWLDEDIIDIERIEVDNFIIPRLVGIPLKRDFE